MREFKGCKNYTLVHTEELTDVDSTAYVLRHDKTGARVCLIANEDENKTFMIGFRTLPTDSTGVPHILEHSVLCGSDKFPVKDAMTEVGKGSLNTFMNAFTYPDRTLYPVASCNNKDFNNLMQVYLDAVFHPMVYKNKNTFLQEGWHYEMENKDADLKINGVVYNEMKGVYSSPEDACSSYCSMSLFPDTQYGVESGGDPKCIPDLSYEDFLEFHKRLYHPSNSRIFLYGDLDFEEKLKYIDEEYLSKYDPIDPNTAITLQKPFDAPKYITKEYSLAEDQKEEDATFLTYNVVCSDYNEIEIMEAMEVINYALCSVPGAKLKERLIDAGIGKDVYSSINDELGQPTFSIVAQDANAEDEAEFVRIVEDTMKEIIREGFDKKTLEASITSQEFSYREADYGFYPRGVVYGMFVFDTWNYTDENIFNALKQNRMFADLRKHLNDGFFEQVLKERVLENTHKTILKCIPVKGLQKKEDAELAAKCKAIKDAMSEAEIDELVKNTKALKDYQEAPDSEEALATIPTLTIKDIDREKEKVEFVKKDWDGVPFVETEIFTNGIAYVNLSFSLKGLPKELYPYLAMAKMYLGRANTKSYKYGELVNEIGINTGSLGEVTSVYNSLKGERLLAALEVRSKVLYDKIPRMLDLAGEILFTTDFTDKKRFKDILEESRTQLNGYAIGAGHAVVIQRMMSYLSENGAINEIFQGLEEFHMIEDLCDHFEDLSDGCLAKMKEALSYVIRKENLTVGITAEKEGLSAFHTAFSDFLKEIPSGKSEKLLYTFDAVKKQEAFTCASQVQYVGMAGNFTAKGLPYHGSLPALRNILANDYLWTSVRLQGGAYGAMCGFMRNGDSYMVSYRDPNVAKTLEAYKNAADYIRNFPLDESLCERYVISAVGDLDTPLTPGFKSQKAFQMYMTGLTNEMLEQEREELLATTPETIRELAKYLDAIINEDSAVCCLGGEEAIKKDQEAFLSVRPLTCS